MGRAGMPSKYVPTFNGGKAIATTNITPEFAGKFDGVSASGSIPVGSMSDLTFVMGNEMYFLKNVNGNL